MGNHKLVTVPITRIRMKTQFLSLMALCLTNWVVPTGCASLHKTIIYLTFDDGPNQGTSLVLDVLKKHQVPATFFINSINLDGTTISQDISHKMILRTVQEGHTLADHSYDHLKHNNYDNQQNYKNLYTDLGYFGASFVGTNCHSSWRFIGRCRKICFRLGPGVGHQLLHQPSPA